MIHVDTKQLARFEWIGHRITGDRRQGSSRGAGYEKVHVAIDDPTRLAYVEVLPDEQKGTTVGFLARAVSWFSEQGITSRRVLSDNGSSYRSGEWRKACTAMDLKPIRTKPYTPRTNGKAERFIQTLCAIRGSITDEGATWPSVASALSSASSRCSLNDLVRKHT
jgi:transposase InsO family protein